MSELIFYTNPMSRGRIVRWMLEELGEPYQTRVLDYGTTMKAPDYLALNPMGKVPAVQRGDLVVTECAAICTWLAETYPDAGLAPSVGTPERAAYLRWMFFGAGPVEAAVTARAFGFDPDSPEAAARAGWGNVDAVADALAGLLSDGRTWLLGETFSALDVYLGSQLMWGRQFDGLPPRDGFDAYLGRIAGREAAIRAREIDDALLKG